ncbi:MAG: ATP-binding protein [Desulfobacterota bacterium]|nr:ATP-binding protein [Thermodesulfobacteriota bacterium]
MDTYSLPAAMTEEQYLKNKLQWLMFFRVIIALFFLGLAAAMHIQEADSYLSFALMSLYVLTGSMCGLTVVYVIALRKIRRLKALVLVQITVDVGMVTILLYITGGINSMFAFLYSIVIIAASICLYLAGGLLAATLASILYATLIVLQHVGKIVPLQLTSIPATGYSDESIYFPIVVNVAAFYLVAILSSFLAEQARKTRLQLQEKQVDIEKLELLHEHIIQNIPSGLMTLDQRNRIITFNRAAEKITGYPAEHVLQRMVHDLFPSLYAVVVERPCDTTGKAGMRREVPFIRRDGTRIYLGISFSPLQDAEGTQLGTIVIFQDLTTYHAMQEQIKRNDRLAAVGRLAAGIAHEIRNPLASISGSVQVLKKSLVLSESDARLMEIIVRESNNLNMLIADFIQFARPGFEKEHSGPVFLHPIVSEIAAMLKNSPESPHRLIITERIPEQLTVAISQQHCKQILWNLMVNAVQSLQEGGGSVTVSAWRKEKGFVPPGSTMQQDTGSERFGAPDWVELRIEDTGCGIPEKDLSAIFDPFFTTKDNGTGLGLSIVHKIVEEYGGTINVESAVGYGTSFTLYLPA